jgi:PAS domain S-box-containing protein
MLRIQQKIVLLSCMMAWGATLVAGVFDYRDDARQARQQSEQVLTAQAELVHNRIRLGFARMPQDARLIASSPILSRSPAGDGKQDLGLHLSRFDRISLARVFRIVINTRPDYSEIAIVRLDGDGRELLRVFRNGDEIAETGPRDLQSRRNEDVTALARATEAGTWAYTGVRPPPARQADALALTPSVSLVYPLGVPNAAPGVFLLITVDARMLVRRSLEDIRLTNSLFVLGGSGDLLGSYIRPADREAGSFAETPSYSDIPAELQFHDGVFGSATRVVDARGQVFLAYDRSEDNENLPGIQVVMAKPIAEMLFLPTQAARRSVLIGGVATFISGLIAGIFAMWVTRPLRQIAESLRRYDWLGPLDGLPVHLKDEVGDVARSFQDVIGRLGRSESRAIAIVESLTDALIVIDPQGTILEFSDVAEQMFQFRREEVMGRNVKLLMPEPFRANHDDYLARFRNSGKSQVMDRTRFLQANRKNGECFPIELTVSVLGEREHMAYVGIVRDITERRQAEEMKDAFISTVNHELRTPLTSIHASLTLLRHHTDGELDDRSRRLIELAQSGSTRLTHLVNDILDLRRIEAGLIAHHAKALDIRALVADIVDRYEPLAERYQVRFRCDPVGDPVMVYLDPGRFEQALVNLLSNAAKFSAAGEMVTISVVRTEPNSVRVNVSDNGPGIPDSFREKIFQRFAQSGSEASRVEGSSGLGLAITKSLVEAFRGTISFDTEIGVGTSFYIDLPVHHSAAGGPSDV